MFRLGPYLLRVLQKARKSKCKTGAVVHSPRDSSSLRRCRWPLRVPFNVCDSRTGSLWVMEEECDGNLSSPPLTLFEAMMCECPHGCRSYSATGFRQTLQDSWSFQKSWAVTTDLVEWRIPLSLFACIPCGLKLRIPFVFVGSWRNSAGSAHGQWVNLFKVFSPGLTEANLSYISKREVKPTLRQMVVSEKDSKNWKQLQGKDKNPSDSSKVVVCHAL